MDFQQNIMLQQMLLSIGLGAYIGGVIAKIKGRQSEVFATVVLTSFLLVLVGFFLKIIQYGGIRNISNILAKPTSTASKEIIVISICLIIFAIILIKKEFKRYGKPFFILSSLLVVFSLFLLVTSYMVPSKPAWNNLFFPLIMVATSISIGVFLTLVIQVFTKESTYTLHTFAYLSSVVVLALIVGYSMYLNFMPNPHESRSMMRFVLGDLRLFFWVSVISYAVSIILTKFSFFKEKRVVYTISFLLVTIGGFYIRVAIFALGTTL